MASTTPPGRAHPVGTPPPIIGGRGGFAGQSLGTPPDSTRQGGPLAPPDAAGPLSGPGIGETYGASHLNQYDQPTALELFAQQQMNGNNPYYQRLQQQQADAINQQMAARGNYNSGGALTALGNASAALNAAQFKDMGDLLGQSSSIGLGRLNAGMNAAGNVQGLEQNRLQQQFGNLSDMAHLGAGLYGGFYGQGGNMSGDAAMAGINAGANSAALAGQKSNAQSGFAMDTMKMMFGGMGGGGGGGSGPAGVGKYGNNLMQPTQF